MLSVDVLLFDLDGTLIDSKKDLALSIHHLQKKYGRPLSTEKEIARFIGDGAAKLVERAIQPGSPERLEEALTFFKAYYRQHALDHTHPYRGVRTLLKYFRKKKMAVVTNKPTRISHYILERLGLDVYFPVIVGGDSVIRKKPFPDALIQALDKLGMNKKSSVLMVGDSAQDVFAGHAAQVHTCGFISNIGDPQLMRQAKPEFTVTSLLDLKRIIK